VTNDATVVWKRASYLMIIIVGNVRGQDVLDGPVGSGAESF
jgi:hypothetical protein